MTDHLPECRYQQVIELYSNDLEPDGCEIEDRCICHQLRACEKRVSARYSRYLMSVVDASYTQGHVDALNAAEAAVAELAVNPYYCEEQYHGADTHLSTQDTLAAIRALQGKP